MLESYISLKCIAPEPANDSSITMVTHGVEEGNDPELEALNWTAGLSLSTQCRRADDGTNINTPHFALRIG